MKKNLFMVAAVALMALVSCNKEEINNGGEVSYEPSVVVEFTAGFDVETKTALDSEGKKTVWNADDCISINDQKFVVSEIKEDGKAIFVNEAPLPADFAAPFTAIYPYGSDGKVPAKQNAVAGNFDPDAVIETATSDNYSLSFKNETSLLKFQVPSDFAETITSVSVSSDNVLAGTDAKTVTITGSFEAGKDYYVAVLPGEATNFVVRINGYLSRNAEKVTINRSSIMNMKTLPAPEKFTWGMVGQHQGWDITKPTPMYKVYDGDGSNNVNDVYALLNVKLSDNGFKFAKFDLKNWNTSNTYFGAWTKSSGKGYYNFTTDCGLGSWYDMWSDSCSGQPENIGVTDWSQNYDVYIKMTEYYTNSQHMHYTIVKAGTVMKF